MFRDERPAPSRRRCTTLHLHKRSFHAPPPHEMHENLGGGPSGAPKPHFGCEGGYSRALGSGAAPTNGAAQAPGPPVAQHSSSRETPIHNHGLLRFAGVSLSPSEREPRDRRAEGVSRSLRESEANSPVRNPSRSDYFKRRARNWRASRFRVNALAYRPGRSRFAACVRRFATRFCVRGGLLEWASAVAWPGAWPTVAGVLADCLSAHRETSRPNLSLVHSSRGRNARTHKQPSPVGAKSRGESARKRRTLVMAAEREGRRRALPTVGISHADIRRRTRAWLPLAVWRSQLHGLRSSSRRECVDWEAYGGDLSGVAQLERLFSLTMGISKNA
jgi:hypothetical protein